MHHKQPNKTKITTKITAVEVLRGLLSYKQTFLTIKERGPQSVSKPALSSTGLGLVDCLLGLSP